MKDWRKLPKRDMIHLFEALYDDKTIERLFRETRIAQKALDASREVCYECRNIAKELGIEE